MIAEEADRQIAIIAGRAAYIEQVAAEELDNLYARIKELEAENERLSAENERLKKRRKTKAGKKKKRKDFFEE